MIILWHLSIMCVRRRATLVCDRWSLSKYPPVVYALAFTLCTYPCPVVICVRALAFPLSTHLCYLYCYGPCAILFVSELYSLQCSQAWHGIQNSVQVVHLHSHNVPAPCGKVSLYFLWQYPWQLPGTLDRETPFCSNLYSDVSRCFEILPWPC